MGLRDWAISHGCPEAEEDEAEDEGFVFDEDEDSEGSEIGETALTWRATSLPRGHQQQQLRSLMRYLNCWIITSS